jgi:hypothetical protein
MIFCQIAFFRRNKAALNVLLYILLLFGLGLDLGSWSVLVFGRGLS